MMSNTELSKLLEEIRVKCGEKLLEDHMNVLAMECRVLAGKALRALGVAAAEPSAGPSAVSPSGTREDAAAVPNADEPPYGAPEDYNEEVYQRRRQVLLELGAKTQQLEDGNVLFTLGKQALTNRVVMGWFSDEAFAPSLELFEREAREMKEASPASDPTSLFTGATVTLDGELITAAGVRYVRVYDPTARYSELFSKAIGVSGPFHVVEIDGPEGRGPLYKADGPGLVDQGWHDDPQGAIHRCRAYNNVWREAMEQAMAPFNDPDAPERIHERVITTSEYPQRTEHA